MTRTQYAAIWLQTEKAATYLRNKGARYWTASVPSGCGELRLIRYTFSDVCDKARTHVAKMYPDALVSFAAPSVVERDIRRIDDAFFRAVARV